MSYTFSIIKPDSISKGHQEAIIRRIRLISKQINHFDSFASLESIQDQNTQSIAAKILMAPHQM